MNRCTTILAAQLVLAMGLSSLRAQHPPSPQFSTDAAAERIPNLDVLKKELREYHDCTCRCGCYAHDMDLQADRAIAFLRQRAAHRAAERKAGADSGYRRYNAFDLPGDAGRRLRVQQAGIRSVDPDRSRRRRFPARCGSTRKRRVWE